MGGNMRLRNKKTGEIREDSDLGKMLSRYEMPSYDSISELCEEWEDYKPVEPLIKDEKIRKAVRAWAEANKNTQVVYDEYCGFDNQLGDTITFVDGNKRLGYLSDHKIYSITELCGDD